MVEIGCQVAALRAAAQEAINTLKCQGFRFNIVKRVGFRTELFFECEDLKGRSSLRFVAEVDDFGNVEFDGDLSQFDNPAHWTNGRPVSAQVFNADGEAV